MENHMITIDNRQKVTITEVADVDSFNEDVIFVCLKKGNMVIKGCNLHIQKLDLAEGKVIITGVVDSLTYIEKKEKQAGSFLNKILK